MRSASCEPREAGRSALGRTRSTMKHFVIPFSVFLIAASSSFAQRQETGGGQKIIGDGNNNTTYYAPAFAYGEPACNLPDRNGNLITGDCVFLYVQGDHNLSDPTYTDQ